MEAIEILKCMEACSFRQEVDIFEKRDNGDFHIGTLTADSVEDVMDFLSGYGKGNPGSSGVYTFKFSKKVSG